MSDKNFEDRMVGGKVGSNPRYEKSLKEGKVVEDLTNITFEEITKVPSPNDPDINKANKKGFFQNPCAWEGTKIPNNTFLSHKGFNVIEDPENEDNFKVIKGRFEKKVHIYQSQNVHTIGDFIVFVGWDDIKYFNTNNKKLITEPIR